MKVVSPTTHGLSNTQEYALWQGAKCSAKLRNIPFTLQPTDVVIPEYCPVFNIPLVKEGGKAGAASPSLDRFDNTMGYTKDNIRVVSWKANRIKGEANVADMEAVLKYMKGEQPNDE